MSDATSVRAGSAHVAPMLAAVAASLPISLRTASDAAAVAIDGGGDWVAEALAAISEGARGVAVHHPCALPGDAMEQLRDTAHARGVSVMLRASWEQHPSLFSLGDALTARDEVNLIDCLASGNRAQPWSPLFDQLLFVLRHIGPIAHLTCDYMAANGHIARAETVADRAPIALTWAADGGLPKLDLRVVSRASMVQVLVEEDERWLPLRAVRFDERGEHGFAPEWESADRAIWRRLHKAVASGETNLDDLEHALHARRAIDAMRGPAR
ncbi:MAG: hypothetical protein V4521_06870 [Pseudomonadota bacterium]